MTKKLFYEDQVRRGMAWLDKNRPGWEQKVDLGIIDLNSGFHCVLGQVDGDFWTSLHEIAQYDLSGEDQEGNSEAYNWAGQHGFVLLFVSGGGGTYNRLTDTWVTLIKERFNSGLALEGD